MIYIRNFSDNLTIKTKSDYNGPIIPHEDRLDYYENIQR